VKTERKNKSLYEDNMLVHIYCSVSNYVPYCALCWTPLSEMWKNETQASQNRNTANIKENEKQRI